MYKKTGQFNPEKKTLKLFLDEYSINDFTFDRAASGIENATLIINLKNKKYALRVYRQSHKSDEDIYMELEFMSLLRRQGLPIPEIFKNKSGSVLTKLQIEGSEWQAILMEYIDGHHADNYTTALIRKLAINQALMHINGIKFAEKNCIGPKLSKLVESEFTHLITKEQLQNPEINSLIQRAKEFEVVLSEDTPYGITHLDYDVENVLVDESEQNIKGILDFDDIKCAPVVVCLAYSLWSVLITTNSFDAVKEYITYYERERKINNKERALIKPVLLFRHYALAALTLLRGELDDEELRTYLRLEKEILEYNFE